MRHTKIIATVGPATDSEVTLDALIAAGADIIRLNFSHGTHDSQAATYERVRAAEQMPSSRRRAAYRAIAGELDVIESALLTHLGITT
jgi:pyruvate kinase